MLTEYRYNKLLILCIAVGFLAALAIGWQRHGLEENNSRVELVMDYEDITGLAQIEGVPVPELMHQFKDAGITSLAVYETTLEKLNKSGKILAVPGSQLLQQYRTGSMNDPRWRNFIEAGRILPEDVYIVGQDPLTFAEVKSDLLRRLSPERVVVLEEGTAPVLAVKASFEKLEKWNLGLSTAEMKEAAGYGFYVVARPTNYNKVTEDDVDAVFDRLWDIPGVSSLMFVGDEVLGYPDLLPHTVKRMQEQQLTLDMIEHPLQLQFLKQDGLLPLAAANHYRSARVYVIPKDEQPKLKPDEAIHRWVLTDQERNIRVNLLRNYEKPELGKTLVETNLDYVAGVRDALLENSFTIGPATYFPPYFPSALLLALVIFGTTAAGVLFLTLVYPFKPRYQYLLLALLTIGLSLPVLAGGGTLIRQATATMSAILFPVLSMTWQLDRWRANESLGSKTGLGRMLVLGTVGLTVTVLLSIMGGLFVGAVLADVRFLLEMEIFRGVKLIFVAPLVLITWVYLTRYSLFEEQLPLDRAGIGRQISKVLNYPVYLKTLLGAAFVAIAAWVYIGRSGHTAGVPVSALELKLRYFLEQVMYARPRGKEFVIGHPAFYLLLMAFCRRWPSTLRYALVVVATIGQGSLAETFAHMRTPIFMSFIRGLDGLFMGIVCGIAALIGVQVLHYLLFVLGRRPAGHE